MPGMSLQRCSQLRKRYQSGFCGTSPSKFGNPVVFVGPGCPTPCAITAKHLRQNPRAYCMAHGRKQASWNDGGCKLASNCNIYCRDTCNKQPNCRWTHGNVCLLKSEYTG